MSVSLGVYKQSINSWGTIAQVNPKILMEAKGQRLHFYKEVHVSCLLLKGNLGISGFARNERVTFVWVVLRFRGSGGSWWEEEKALRLVQSSSFFLSPIFISPARESVVTLRSQYTPSEAAADLTDAYTCISVIWQKLMIILYPRIWRHMLN